MGDAPAHVSMPEASPGQRPGDETKPARRAQRNFSPANRGGGRGRQQGGMQSPGGMGPPPGLGQQQQQQQYQQQQRGWGPQDGGSRFQNGGEHHNEQLVVGTSLQGFVDHVREKFGFIRIPGVGEPVFFHISEVQQDPAQLSDRPAGAAADASPGSEPHVAAQDAAAASQQAADAVSAAEVPAADQAAGPAEEAQEAQEQPKQDTPSGKQRERRPPFDRSVELSSLVQPGDAVEFVVAASSHDGVRHRGSRPPRMTAKQVRKLPPGTLLAAAAPSREERMQGRVERPLSNAGASSDTWTNRETSNGQGGLVSYPDPDAAAAPSGSGGAAAARPPSPSPGAGGDAAGRAGGSSQQPRIFLPFEGADVKGRMGRALKRGDPVEFQIACDARTGKRRATQVQPLKQGDSSRREQGFVDKFVATYGFVRSVDREGAPPMFFHISEVAGGAGSGIGPGSEVSFAVVPDPTAAGRGDKYNAVHLEVLPAGTVAEERSLPERVRGRILRPAAKVAEEGQAAPLAGKVTFEDEAGNVRSCFYTLDQVQGGEEEAGALGHDDEVEFGVVVNRRSGSYRAEGLQLLCRAEERRELGQVKQLHEGREAGQGFGFIRPCERAGDLFFHFSQLAGVAAAELAAGDDVEFSIVREPTPEAPKRVVASRVTRAAKGSAVFDVVSERVYSGIVLERMHAKGTNVTSGLLQALDDDAVGKLTYGPKDLVDPKSNPKALDQVTFRTAINPRAVKAAEKVGGVAAQHAGRRATQVALPAYTGRVVTFKGSFGFLEYDRDAQQAAASSTGDGDPPPAEPKEPGMATADGSADAPASSSANGLGRGAAHAEASGDEDKASAAGETGRTLPRVYFNVNDVEGSAALKPGDEVRFTLAAKPGGRGTDAGGGGEGKAPAAHGGAPGGKEVVARRVLRTKEAPTREVEEFTAERNPQAIKFTSNLVQQGGAAKVRDAVRMAKGPDGTRGFAPGRGRPLPTPPPGGQPAAPLAPGSGLHTVGSSGALNPTAAEFVPRFSKDMGSPATAATADSAAAAGSSDKGESAAPTEKEAEEPTPLQPAADATAEEPVDKEEEAATSELAPPAVASPAAASHAPAGSGHPAQSSASPQDPIAALLLAVPAEEDATAGPAEHPTGAGQVSAQADLAAASPFGVDPFAAARAPSTGSLLGGDPFAAPVSECSVHGSEQVSELASAFSGTSLSEQLAGLMPEGGGGAGLMDSLADSAARAQAAATAAVDGANLAVREEGGDGSHHGQPGGALMGLDGEGAAM